MWDPGKTRCPRQEKKSNNYPAQCSNLLIKVLWVEKLARSWILPPLSWVLGLFLSSGCPPLPAVGLLQAAFCWPATFFHTSARRVRRAVSSSLHPSSSTPAMPSTHPQRRRRRLVTVAISEKPKLALLAVHRWQRHFAFLLIRKQNNMIKRGPIRRRVDKHVPQIAEKDLLSHLL